MTRNISLVLLTLAPFLLSCATTDSPGPASMPAARASMRPEHRIFYDSLADYGEWVLIEPYGYVFRPRLEFHDWRPYTEGFWVPTDTWGWVWISAEPFGWATYHYGRWFYDMFQGWVWQPALDWGPAWVAWQMTDDYAGWSPLFASGSTGTQIPGGTYVYAPLAQLSSTDLKTRIVSEEKLDSEIQKAKPVRNVIERNGVRIDLGPSIAEVERLAGVRFERVRLEDSVPVDLAESIRTAPERRTMPAPVIEATRRAGEDAAREARSWQQRGARVPARVPVVRPLGTGTGATETPAGRSRLRAPAPRDTVSGPR